VPLRNLRQQQAVNKPNAFCHWVKKGHLLLRVAHGTRIPKFRAYENQFSPTKIEAAENKKDSGLLSQQNLITEHNAFDAARSHALS
jgi:hypothetical protein